MSAGQRVWVIESLAFGGGFWHHVVVEDTFMPGWISDGPTDQWFAPFDRTTCPSSLGDEFERQTLDGNEMRSLVCFGSAPQTLAVYWPTPDQTGVDVPCPWSEPRWLLCYEYVNVSADASRGLAVYGTSELPDFDRGGWMSLVGHYDDPRAEDCPEALGRPLDDAGEVAASVLFCRTRFVVESVSPQ